MESVLSILTLGALIWIARVLLPRAIRQGEWFAVCCAVVTFVFALLLWFLVGALPVF